MDVILRHQAPTDMDQPVLCAQRQVSFLPSSPRRKAKAQCSIGKMPLLRAPCGACVYIGRGRENVATAGVTLPLGSSTFKWVAHRRYGYEIKP